MIGRAEAYGGGGPRRKSGRCSRDDTDEAAAYVDYATRAVWRADSVVYPLDENGAAKKSTGGKHCGGGAAAAATRAAVGWGRPRCKLQKLARREDQVIERDR